jgi:hypothetical protein
MRDHYHEAVKLLDDLDGLHRLSPTERVARAQVMAALAQVQASQAMVEVLGRIADALDGPHPDSDAASGPSALVSRMVPRRGPRTGTDAPGRAPAHQSLAHDSDRSTPNL